MKTSTITNMTRVKLATSLLCALAVCSGTARASQAYGSINNFDTVNDTGHECHGFEIELEDCHSTDITYTYNYNHYGAPNITEDNSVAGHPKCIIRWESKKKPDGTWAAYTAIPAGPIAPTNGHMFTNPGVNFGGEHFGAGYRVAVGAVRYNWLIDNGAGVLVHGGAVQVATPTFTYYPPVVGNPAPPQVQAVIAPPPPPAPEPKEFGKAVWVKEIRTTTHNNNEVKLRDLVSDDPANANDKNWKNGEPDEVEVEWQMLQKDYNKADGGANNQVPAAAEALPGGDEVVTRRYEFYKYVGPLDTETGEAMAQSVAADGIHGVGVKIVNGANMDLSTVAVVGDFTGAQMAAVDVDAPVGLIDHVGEGRVNTPFAARTVVVEGAHPFSAVREGSLPPGMAFNEVTGVLSGTPTAGGQFQFKVTASDGVNPDVSKSYTLSVAAAGAALPPACLLDTTVSPVGSGTTTGDGSYAVGANATVTAAPAPGFAFVNWTDNAQIVGTNSSYTLAMDVNHSLVANFAPTYTISTSATPPVGGTIAGDGTFVEGSNVTVTATPEAGYTFTNWTENGVVVSNAASFTFAIASDRTLVANFAQGTSYTVSTSAAPAAGGTSAGGGTFANGASTTVTATPGAGYAFVNWTEGGAQVSANASYTFTVTSNRSLVANFILLGGTARVISTSSSPVAGGTTSGGGSYADSTSVTVTATANPGYKFSKWKEGGTTVSTSPSYTFTASADRNLVATFIQAYTIATSAAPAAGGATEMDSLTYKLDETAQARAFPNAGYQFLNWTENGTVVSTQTPYSFNVTGNRTLVANFQLIGGVNISASAAPAAGGTTAGGGGYMTGNNVTLTATPNAGYAFVNWTEGGVEVSTSPAYSFPASVSRTLVANFLAGCTITTSSSPSPGGATSGGGAYASGDSVTVSATAAPGYQFVDWTEAGIEVSTALDYTFTAAADRDLVANFVITSGAVKFDFDTSAPAVQTGQILPLSQSAAGVTAQFSSPGPDAFAVGNATSTGHTLSGLSGNYLAPGTDISVLEVTFDQPASSVDANFALVETLQLAGHSTLKLTAIDNTSGAEVVVGTVLAHGVNQGSDSLAGGTLSFSSATPFNLVRVEVAVAAEAGAKFLIDNIGMTPFANAGGVTLANPNWNITLSSYGYSDLLLDNTPGFEGREYLSGEWGAAVGYTNGSGSVTPKWLEPNFIYPDWTTNSTFHVVSPATIVATVGGLDIAQSVIANNDMEITIRCEMVDSLTGTPMGITPASAAGAGQSIRSNRYVLKQTYTVKNTSGAALSNVQFFQMLHGLNSQKGVHDNRAHLGPLSEYRYDTTLHGVDPSAVGSAGASNAGLEDFIGFHSMTSPSQFEIGRYGDDTVDNHGIGKPSDGVHLSIEDNWQHAPYTTRAGTDEFAPANYWIAGAQRWNLGSIAPGQSTSHSVLLSILTGTKVTTGGTGAGGCNGGSSKVGGLDYDFDAVETEGDFFGDFSEADDAEIAERISEGEFGGFTFTEPNGKSQLWNLKFNGTHTGNITLTFAYDPTLLPAGFDESKLVIYHYKNGAWEKLSGTVDVVNHKITIVTSSLSPFVLGVNQAGGTVVYEQPASSTSGAAYNSAINIPNGWAYEELRWDSFTVPASQTIREIHWRGTYAGAQPSEFEIRICPSIPAGTQPDVAAAPLASWQVNGNAGETPAGVVGGVTMYDYAFTLPAGFTATAGTKYWLQIIAHQTSAPDWSWAAGTGGDSSHFARVAAVTGDWSFVYGQGDLAFTLLNQSTSPVTVSLTASPGGNGTVSGGGTFAPGTSVTVTATPTAGKAFLNWTEYGNIVSSNASYTFTATGSTSLVANFSGVGNGPYTIAASAFPSIAGTVGGAGSFGAGDSVNVDASPADGFVFVNWTENGVPVSALASYGFTASANRNLVANFTVDGTSSYRVVSATASPYVAGTTTGGGAFMANQVITLTATPSAGYVFLNWTRNGVPVGSNTSYTMTVTNNDALTANFSAVYTISATASPSGGGSTSGAATYAGGAGVTMTATPQPGYAFVNWTEGGTVVSANATYAFTASADRNLVANFAASCAISATPNPAAGGTVQGAGTYLEGQNVTLTAAPAAGYQFVRWTEGGAEAGTNASLAFTASASRSLVAEFALVLPTMASTVTAPGELVLSWPANATGWILQESPDLTPGSWVTSTLPVTVAGNMNRVTVTMNGSSCFFRLVHP